MGAEAKHTPGPWEGDMGELSCGCSISSDGCDMRFCPLHASAPLLLEALKRALEWGEAEIHNEYDGTTMLSERLTELDFMRAALAVAEPEVKP